MQVKKACIKNNIDAAALSLFSSYSFEKVSMRQIAKKADITVGNIYRYYKSKDELFEALVLPTLDEIRNMIKEESMEQYVGLPNQYTLFVQHMIDLFLSIHQQHTQILDILINGCEGSRIIQPKESIRELLAKKMLPLIHGYKMRENKSIDTGFIADLLSDGLIDHFIKILYEFDDNNIRKIHMYEITRIYMALFMTESREKDEKNFISFSNPVSMGL